MMNVLVKFHVNCGRSGDLNGLFVSTMEKLVALHGKRVYFGEVLGKHSEVEVVFGPEDYKVVCVDEVFIDRLVDINEGEETISGFNPFDYYEESEEELEDED